MLFVDAFDCTQTFSKFMNSQIDLSKRSFSEYFSNSVEVNGSLRSLVVLAKAKFNKFDKFSDLSASRSV